MQEYVVINGNFLEKERAGLLITGTGDQLSDGVFETIRVVNQKVLLCDYHFERLFHGLGTLKIHGSSELNRKKLEAEILGLCKKNQCTAATRVRLSVSGGKDHLPEYIIECWPLPADMMQINQQGWKTDIFREETKRIDQFSNLKLTGCHPYASAGIYAKENNLDDCLLLNTEGKVCDSSIANVFWVKSNIIYTPPLSQGCVAGVMRRWILDNRLQIADLGFSMRESVLTENDLKNADEVFLTNAIRGIRWVGSFREKEYTRRVASLLYSRIVQTISA